MDYSSIATTENATDNALPAKVNTARNLSISGNNSIDPIDKHTVQNSTSIPPITFDPFHNPMSANNENVPTSSTSNSIVDNDSTNETIHTTHNSEPMHVTHNDDNDNVLNHTKDEDNLNYNNVNTFTNSDNDAMNDETNSNHLMPQEHARDQLR